MSPTASKSWSQGKNDHEKPVAQSISAHSSIRKEPRREDSHRTNERTERCDVAIEPNRAVSAIRPRPAGRPTTLGHMHPPRTIGWFPFARHHASRGWPPPAGCQTDVRARAPDGSAPTVSRPRPAPAPASVAAVTPVPSHGIQPHRTGPEPDVNVARYVPRPRLIASRRRCARFGRWLAWRFHRGGCGAVLTWARRSRPG